jgi:hypothetical protein
MEILLGCKVKTVLPCSSTMKACTVTLILLATALVGGWLGLSLPAKLKYEQARKENSIAYQVTSMDQSFIAFLTDVQSNWACKVDVTNGPDSEVVKLAGMTPSVRNLIFVFNYQMPQYRWFSPSQNRKSAAINLIKAKFVPVSIDQRWYLSDDEHLAVLRCYTNVVYIYRDGASGLRATLYVKKKNESGNPNTPSDN